MIEWYEEYEDDEDEYEYDDDEDEDDDDDEDGDGQEGEKNTIEWAANPTFAPLNTCFTLLTNSSPAF